MNTKSTKPTTTAFAGSIPDIGIGTRAKKGAVIKVGVVRHPRAKARKIVAPKILFRYRSKDSLLGVQKATVERIEEMLGLNETQVIHYALAKLAKEVIPAYEPDDGPLTAAQIKLIRKLSGVDQDMPMTSTLFA